MTRIEALKKIRYYLMTDVLHGKDSKDQASMLLDFFETELKMEQVVRSSEVYYSYSNYLGTTSMVNITFGWDRESKDETK